MRYKATRPAVTTGFGTLPNKAMQLTQARCTTELYHSHWSVRIEIPRIHTVWLFCMTSECVFIRLKKNSCLQYQIFRLHMTWWSHMKYPMLLFVACFVATTLYAETNPSPDQSIAYKETPQGTLFLHAFYPENWKPTDTRPAVVFFFGGGWNSGSYTQFSRHAEYLASRGMVAFCADYRVNKKHKTEPKVCVSDGKSAVRWIRSHANDLGVDPNKIIAGGGSAGGHVAAATATITAFDEDGDDSSISPRPQALILFNPVIDNSKNGYGHNRVEPYWKQFSPLHNIKAGIPPTIFICGTKDKLIPVETGEQFREKIENVGGRCDLVWYENQSHGFFNKMYEETMHDVDQFLVSLGYLYGPATLMQSENVDEKTLSNN